MQNWLKESDKRLEAGGRRTDEETGTGPWSERERLGLRSVRSQRHKHNRRRSHRNRRCCVHHHAERALVGICLIGMKMGYLNQRKNGQQSNAHQRYRYAKTGAGAAAGLCLKSNQDTYPLLQEYTPF